RQAVGRCERVKAVARKLVRRDIIADIARSHGLDQQVPNEVAELLVRSGDVLTSMQECRELGAVVLVGNERVGFEHGLEALGSRARPVADFSELFEMAGDLSLVPGE